MLIAEDLLLLATDETTGKSSISTMQLDPALAGAVLMELVVAGRIGLEGQERKAQVVVIDTTPLGDPTLDPALQTLLEKAPIRPVSAIGKLGKGLRERLYNGLEDRGILRRDSGRILGIFPTTSWPAEDSRHEDELRKDISNVLVIGQEPTARVAAIIAVLTAADMLKTVVDKPDLKLAKERGQRISDGNWATDSVRKAIQEMQAAMSVAVMVSTTAVVVGGSS
jgi:hypothetical protein